jgi:hypothetical protein
MARIRLVDGVLHIEGFRFNPHTIAGHWLHIDGVDEVIFRSCDIGAKVNIVGHNEDGEETFRLHSKTAPPVESEDPVSLKIEINNKAKDAPHRLANGTLTEGMSVKDLLPKIH